MKRPYLFAKDDLDQRLRAGSQGAAETVNQIPEPQFLASSDEEVFEHVKAPWTVQPIVLQEDAARMDQSETQVDVSRDPNRFLSGENGGSFYIPGTQILIRVPYSGTGWLWHCRTNPYSTNHPVGTVTEQQGGGTLELSISLPHDAPAERFKQLHDENMNPIRTFIERGTAQVMTYNQQLDGVIRNAIAQRRQRLKQHSGLADILKIPAAGKGRCAVYAADTR
jgi:hypothetical protein